MPVDTSVMLHTIKDIVKHFLIKTIDFERDFGIDKNKVGWWSMKYEVWSMKYEEL